MTRRWYTLSALAALGLAGLALLLVPSVATTQTASSIAPVAQQNKAPAGKKTQGAKKRNQAANPSRAAVPAPAASDAPDLPVLSSGDSYDDFASVAQAADGTLYAAYAAYYNGHDQVRIHKRLPSGKWSTRTEMATVEARPDIWMPQLAVDARDRLWVVWCEQIERTKTESGNWELFARVLDGDAWGPVVRLSDDPKPDINPHVATDAKQNIYVVWQAHPENNGDIKLRQFDGNKWTDAIPVTSGPGADWYPHVAIDAKGTAWIALDSYRNGDYDVFLTSVANGKVGKLMPIATSKFYEAHASVACTPDGRVWVAWEQGGHNWGKDQGHWLKLNDRENGTTLGSTRSVHVVAVHDGQIYAAPPIDTALTSDLKLTAMATLAADKEGRLWLAFRNQRRGEQRRPGQFAKYWTAEATTLTADGWKQSQMLPGSNGRISVFSRILPTADGGLAVAYSSDQRGPANYHQPIHDQALVAVLPRPDERPGTAELKPYEAPKMPEDFREWDTPRETREVTAAREHRVTIDGRSQRIVRGDLHRHTEMSWDIGPGIDGSYLDFYRYMIDVAEMDFGALTDHQGGGHYAYHWWLTEKSADMYYLPPRFVPLYGYERSARFPNGHRNIFHSYRGVPVFPFQVKLKLTGVFPGVGAGDLLDNDTKLLYEYLHRTGGVAISHTSATDQMGTDWRDNDPQIEPVVEIYQGDRNSYEVEGGPRVHDLTKMAPAQAPGGYQSAGLVWNALAKGYRLGMTASSDHFSTHISYSLVYTPENKREAILDGIRRRHTYGATDNLIIEGWANGHFMGDEFTLKERPSLELKCTGTDKIARVDLVCNNKYIYTTSPLKEKVEIKYTDMSARPGLNYYYFRIEQDNGEVAWASPVWIDYQP